MNHKQHWIGQSKESDDSEKKRERKCSERNRRKKTNRARNILLNVECRCFLYRHTNAVDLFFSQQHRAMEATAMAKSSTTTMLQYSREKKKLYFLQVLLTFLFLSSSPLFPNSFFTIVIINMVIYYSQTNAICLFSMHVLHSRSTNETCIPNEEIQ